MQPKPRPITSWSNAGNEADCGLAVHGKPSHVEIVLPVLESGSWPRSFVPEHFTRPSPSTKHVVSYPVTAYRLGPGAPLPRSKEVRPHPEISTQKRARFFMARAPLGLRHASSSSLDNARGNALRVPSLAPCVRAARAPGSRGP